MKKTNIKRIAAFTASILAVAALAVPMTSVFTADAADYDITISAPNGMTLSSAANEFKAYKIFNLSYDATSKAATYTAVDGVDLSGFYATANNATDVKGIITWLGDGTDVEKEAKARTFADWVYENLIKDGTLAAKVTATATADSTSVVLNTGDTGYYLVYGVAINPDGAETFDTVVSQVMLTSTATTADVTLKLDAPSLDKEIKHNELATWGDVGDNQIGDDVEYRIITSVPAMKGYQDGVNDYKYIIHDTMTTGLTFNNDVKIMINDTTELADTYYTVAAADDQNFTVTVDIDKAIEAKVLEADDDLYTYYTAELNENALVATGNGDSTNHNDNIAYLEYSNNPYVDTSTGKTPEVEVYDWTFFETITKVDEAGDGLAGAIFEIYETDPTDASATPLTFNKGDGEVYTVDADGDGSVTQITSVEASGFTLKGLDDSKTYYVKEVTPPVGYEAITAAKTFKLTATYGDTTPDTLATLTDDDASDDANNLAIVNTSGTLLPSTGGIGTTLFYIGGGALALGAGVLLVSKKRMANK